MSDLEYQWTESGRGAAPRQQRVVVTAATRAEEAFEAYGAHLSDCRQCNDRILNGGDFCDEGKQLGEAYVAAYDESRAEGRTQATGELDA